MFLADFGAEVVKVGHSGGPGRVMRDRGKTVVEPPVPQVLARWLAAADVVVSDRPLAGLAGTPLEPEAAIAANPGLVYLHTPAFDGTEDWEDAVTDPEAMVSGLMGIATRQASHSGGPIDVIVPVITTVQGIWAAAATVAALIERRTSGRGQIVTVGGAHGALLAGAAAYSFDESVPDPPGRRPGGPGGAIPFYRPYRCADGEWLFLAALTPHFTERAFAALELEEISQDPRLGGGGRAAMLNPDNVEWLVADIGARFALRPRAEWLDALATAGVPAGPLADREAWLDHPQLAAIDMVDHRSDGTSRVVTPGHPIRLVATPAEVSTGAIHPDGWQTRTPDPGSGAPDRPGPLAGVTVLDLGAIIAGPYAGSLLGELGAEVIKVEPLGGDSFRGPGFAAYNKGQKGVALDLRHPDGRRALLDLAAKADVLIDNYRPGVLHRLGLTHEDLSAVNPGLVSVSITGFGEGGPLGHEAGFDPVLQALSGMMGAQGGGDEPVFLTVPVNDVAAAASAALAACLALHARPAHGAQRAWTSLAAMSALLQADDVVRFDGRPSPAAGGPDHRGRDAAHRFHPAADGWIRVEADDQPLSPIPENLRSMSRAQAVAEMSDRQVPCAPVCPARSPGGDPDRFLHRDPRPGRETWRTAGRLARFSRTERADTLTSPALGEHTGAVLATVGWDGHEIEKLFAAGAAKSR